MGRIGKQWDAIGEKNDEMRRRKTQLQTQFIAFMRLVGGIDIYLGEYLSYLDTIFFFNSAEGRVCMKSCAAIVNCVECKW